MPILHTFLFQHLEAALVRIPHSLFRPKASRNDQGSGPEAVADVVAGIAVVDARGGHGMRVKECQGVSLQTLRTSWR